MTTASRLTHRNKPLLGVYTGAADDSGTPDTFNPPLTYNQYATQQFASVITATGRTPRLFNVYIDESMADTQWVSSNQYIIDSWAANSWMNNLIPLLAMPMSSPSDSSANAGFLKITSGSLDTTFNTIWQNWVNAGHKLIYIRPGWEFNGTWQPWSVTSANNANYIAAFQHMAALAHAFANATIRVVWNPNVGNNGAVATASSYPGDVAVDIHSIDGYGPPFDGGDPPNDAAALPSWTYPNAMAFAAAHGKPFSISECGCLDTTYIGLLSAALAASPAPLAFLSLWNVNDASANLSWSNVSDGLPAVLAAWKALIIKFCSP